MIAPIDVTNIRIETPRLILRAWRESDLQDFYEYARVDGVGQMAGWKPHESIEESAKILRMFIEEKKTLALELKENGKAIGSIGIEKREDALTLPESVQGRELGYVLAKDYWGRGLMTEAVKAVIDYCFHVLSYDYITCGHFERNSRSRRVIEKCGFQYVNSFDFTTRVGTVEPTRMYVLKRDDYIFSKMNAPFDVSGISLETQRLTLRPMTPEDYPFYRGMSVLSEVADVSGWDAGEPESETQQRFQRQLARKETLILVLRETGAMIGTLSLQGREWHIYPIDHALKGREFAFDLHPDYWGQGLMPEAVAAVTEYCFKTLAFDFLTAGFFHGNHRSQRVIEKSGFSYLFDYDVKFSQEWSVTVSTFIRYKES